MKDRGAENIRIVKGFYRSFLDESVLAPEIDWTEPAPEVLPFGGRHHGTAAVIKDVIEVIHDTIIDFEVKPKKFFAVEDMVIVLGHSTGRGRITDIKLDAPTAHIWTMAHGRAVRFQAYHDVLEWQVVLGLTSVQSQRLAA